AACPPPPPPVKVVSVPTGVSVEVDPEVDLEAAGDGEWVLHPPAVAWNLHSDPRTIDAVPPGLAVAPAGQSVMVRRYGPPDGHGFRRIKARADETRFVGSAADPGTVLLAKSLWRCGDGDRSAAAVELLTHLMEGPPWVPSEVAAAVKAVWQWHRRHPSPPGPWPTTEGKGK
ncbi:MAG: hypothetical protein K2V38_13290, partial [Gemmataceae bacterium]|nr:hypothetical protein [Gemmataceae bacterium]